MKTTFLVSLLLLICNTIGWAEETSNSAANFQGTYFVITPDGQYETLYIEPHHEIILNRQRYWRYSGYFKSGKYEESYLLLREDETKIYRYNTKTNTEHLLFDFGLKKGDTYFDSLDGTEYLVTDVRDTLINNKNIHLIELRSQENKHDIWLEGIGSIHTGVLRSDDYCKEIYQLTCPRYYTIENGNEMGLLYYCFYPNNHYIKTAGMNYEASQWEGKEPQTDEEWEAYIEWQNAPSNLNAEFIGDTLHVWGRLRTACELQPYAACELKENNATFRTYSLADMDCFSNYNIETRIPGFAKGTYQIQLNNKTVELKCNGVIPTSVNKHSIPMQKNTFYDLQGRPLPSKPSQGIYLEAGKKKAAFR